MDNLNTSLKNSSLMNGGAASDHIPSTIQAYKSDNAKLIKENNELHLQFIKFKDEYEAQFKGIIQTQFNRVLISEIIVSIHFAEMKIKLSKVEHENSDLRFLNTQYLHKLRAIEKESKDKSKKILELQEKNFQAVIQTPSNRIA